MALFAFSGELCTAMGKIQVGMEPPIAPYFDLFKVHHAVGTADVFYKQVSSNPDFEVCREDIDFLVSEIRGIEGKIEEYKRLDLPKQLIHGVGFPTTDSAGFQAELFEHDPDL